MNMVQDAVQDRYDVKTIEYKDERGMAITLMLIKFDGIGNDALERAGWRGDYLGVVEVDGGFREATNNFHSWCRRVENHEDGELLDFLTGINRGVIPFTAPTDGATYTNSDLRHIVDKFQ